MEAVALASTFATLLGFSMQLYGNCKYYVDAARGDCPNDLKLILIETSSLEATLRTVQDILAASDTRREDEARLQRQIGKSVEECKSCLEKLLKLVPKPLLRDEDHKLSKRDKAKILLNALAWGTSGKKGECDIQLKHLRAHKATLSLNLTAELSHEVKKISADVTEVKTSVNTMQTKLDASQRAEVYKWLEQVNPSKNHNNARQLHKKETGQWLTRTDQWKNWIDGAPDPKSRFLWLHGIPGAGKTVLAYTIIEQVRARAKADNSQGFAFYYCYHGRNKDEAVPFLTWVICQLCRQSECIPVILTELFRHGCEPTVEELLDCLEAILTRFRQAYVVVDAVDESNPRKNMIGVLSDLGSNKRFAKIRLAVTSREYQDVEHAFKPRSVAMSMANTGVKDDIRRCVELTLQDPQYASWGRELRDVVAHLVPEKADGMFRYAACQLELLADCHTVDEVKRELSHLPATLNETYERILRKIEPKHRDEAVRALALILGSLENIGPILVQTLVTGVVGGPGIKSFCTIDTLRRHCICLIKVRAEDNTVHMAHYTVREFLQSRDIQKKLPAFALPEKKVNEIYFNTIMSTAAQFSGTPSVHNMPEDGNGDPVDFRLYALRRTRVAMFWHRQTLGEGRENKKLLLQLLNPYEPSFPGLRALGSDGHSDDSNQATFDWIPKYNPSADAAEKAAAHLTMLVGFKNLDLVKEFLKSKSDQDKATLFSTEMKVVLPAEWKIYSKRGTFDPKPSSVTVLDFFKEGQKRGFDTDVELNMLRGAFGAYSRGVPESKPASSVSTKKTPAPTPARNNPPAPTINIPTPSSRDTAPPPAAAPSSKKSSTRPSSKGPANLGLSTGGGGPAKSNPPPRSPSNIPRSPGSTSTSTFAGRKSSTSNSRIPQLHGDGRGQGQGGKQQTPVPAVNSSASSTSGSRSGVNNAAQNAQNGGGSSSKDTMRR
ncbi:hypothetical protein C8A01DRAFT_20467 [Parachaetomium inaequale]|uniref:NACHT domain-containing protein n=1 Tax=Parachaetomium inaequale TaxID=2588326 RepID=A0AAN6SMD5_9PEZI|nr:hypothetical protein C8A01DRAFT_20467 [Parachaetomium inaequale]